MVDGSLLERLSASFQADVVLFLVEERGAHLAVADYRRLGGNCPTWDGAIGTRYRLGENLPGRVWETGQPLLIPEVESTALYELALGGTKPIVQGMTSLMLTPILDGARARGVVAVLRKQGPSFTEGDLRELRVQLLADV